MIGRLQPSARSGAVTHGSFHREGAKDAKDAKVSCHPEELMALGAATRDERGGGSSGLG